MLKYKMNEWMTKNLIEDEKTRASQAPRQPFFRGQ